MAARRLVSALRSGPARVAPLSTAPAARERPAAGLGAAPGCGAAEAARPPWPVVDFGSPREAYRSRRSGELVRGWLVLRLCASPWLLAHHEQLLHLTRRLLGQRLFEKLMKMTFYGQFVAGEDQESIRPVIQHNRAFGVGSILDYGVEEDLSPEEAERKEMESCTSAAEREGSGTSKRERQYQAHPAFGDRRDGVISARTYFYASEAKCDSHMETFLRCIEASGGASDDGFSAIKLTALGRPQFLLQFSDVLTKWRRFFHQMAAEQGKTGLAAMDTKLEVAVLQESVAKMGIASRTEIENWFTTETLGVSGPWRPCAHAASPAAPWTCWTGTASSTAGPSSPSTWWFLTCRWHPSPLSPVSSGCRAEKGMFPVPYPGATAGREHCSSWPHSTLWSGGRGQIPECPTEGHRDPCHLPVHAGPSQTLMA